jgi:putative two-component system response regulator
VSGWEEAEERLPAPAETPPVILIVEPHEINRRLLSGMLAPGGYRLVETPRTVEAFEILRSTQVDLVIVDLMLPETSGLDFCRRLKASRQTFLIPVVMVTSVPDVEARVAGLEAGADEFLLRPLNAAVVRTRVAALLRQKAAVDSLEEAESLLFVLAQAIEQRDEAISGHCKRLEEISSALGTALGLSHTQLVALRRGAYLHDIGKVSVPDSILFKPGPLTPREWGIMRQHPVKGEEICRPVKSLAPVLPIIRSHHERWDGSGYPDSLAGEDIPLLARVLQIADIYDALTSPRPYKPALSASRALQILDDEARYGWRDPQLVHLFRSVWKTTMWLAENTRPPRPRPPASLGPSLEPLPAAAVK